MLPESITQLLECPDPCRTPPSPVYATYKPFNDLDLPITLSLQDFGWLLARSFSNCQDRSSTAETEESSSVPVWSAYNARIGNSMHTTRVGMPPLIASPVHEWHTLLTILKQAQNITTKVFFIDHDISIYHGRVLHHFCNTLDFKQNKLLLISVKCPISSFIKISNYC